MNPRIHPIIKYIGGMIVGAGRNGAKLDLFGLSLESVKDWCMEAAANCPTDTRMIHIPNLSIFIDRIPATYRWWIPLGEDSGTLCTYALLIMY